MKNSSSSLTCIAKKLSLVKKTFPFKTLHFLAQISEILGFALTPQRGYTVPYSAQGINKAISADFLEDST